MKRLVWVLLAVVMAAGAWAQRVKVACIGDSITFGFGLKARDKESYPVKLQALLGSDYEVRNFGNSGRGIYQHSWRGKEKRAYRAMKEHQEALAWQPDIVICNLGINDCGEFLKTERRAPGTFRKDYLALLADYQALPSHPKFYLWTRLSPLAPGQKFYRSPEPFLMQRELEAVAAEVNAVAIDMETPLKPYVTTFFPDKLHPNAQGAALIAITTAEALKPGKVDRAKAARERITNSQGWALPWPATEPVTLPEGLEGKAETWLCAGQSNMFWPLSRCTAAAEEAAETANHEIWLWDYVSGVWQRITPQNAGIWSAMAISFANRRARASGKPIALLLVGVGGAPTESFLAADVMAAVKPDGSPKYPRLHKIVTNRKPLDQNEDYPRTWCKQVYPNRLRQESAGWEVNRLYNCAIARVRSLPLTGVLWYQGESNASVAIGGERDTPLEEPYMEETLHAVIESLRPNDKIPFLMVGLPVMNRPWEPYRKLQAKVCAATPNAIYLDTFSRKLGEANNIHPKNKRPFADLAAEAADLALDPAKPTPHSL